MLFSPWLAKSGPAAKRAERLSNEFRHALAARIWWISRIACDSDGRRLSDDLFMRLLHQSGLNERISHHAINPGSDFSLRSWFGGAQIDRLNSNGIPAIGVWAKRSRADDWLSVRDYQLGTLALLASALQSVRSDDDGDLVRVDISELTLPEIGLIAIHGGINPAYVVDIPESRHETFAVAAWIGILLRGRDAILPIQIAPTLLSVLSSASVRSARSESRILDDIISFHAALAAGRQRLLAAARQVIRRGSPVTVRSRAPAPHALASAEAKAPLYRPLPLGVLHARNA